MTGATRSWLARVRSTLDADQALMAMMSGFIRLSGSRYALDPGDRFSPGKPLRLLLAGYNGTRNTGSDVRVEEMIRQFRHLFGEDNLDLTVLTIDPTASRGYFRAVRQARLPDIYPRFLFDMIHSQHGVVACEGSMFKSKFANALSTMMIGALGIANAEGKLSIGYGAEAGAMDAGLQELVRKHCRESFVVTRNAASCKTLASLGVDSFEGTDTAWTFEPASPQVGLEKLLQAGWNGSDPIIAVAPINAFWWPVAPDPIRAGRLTLSRRKDASHYKSIYFHADGPEIREKQRRYIDALAFAVSERVRRARAFPIIVGMERLDRLACEALAASIGQSVPLFVSDEHDMYTLVSILRQSSVLISSRYHAIVTSMPAGVPSIGVTMDERIPNLMEDRAHRQYCFAVDEDDLGPKLTQAIASIETDSGQIAREIGATTVEHLERLGDMGRALVSFARDFYPELASSMPRRDYQDSLSYLPKLSGTLEELIAEHS